MVLSKAQEILYLYCYVTPLQTNTVISWEETLSE